MEGVFGGTFDKELLWGILGSNFFWIFSLGELWGNLRFMNPCNREPFGGTRGGRANHPTTKTFGKNPYKLKLINCSLTSRGLEV